MDEKIEEIIATLINGNISDFDKWLETASKVDMLKAIEHYSGNYGSRHQIICSMMALLTKHKEED